MLSNALLTSEFGIRRKLRGVYLEMTQREADNPEPEGFACVRTLGLGVNVSQWIRGECPGSGTHLASSSPRKADCIWGVKTAVPIIRLAYGTLETKQPEDKTKLLSDGRSTERLVPSIRQRQDCWRFASHPSCSTEICRSELTWRKEAIGKGKGKMNWKCALIFIIFLLKTGY